MTLQNLLNPRFDLQFVLQHHETDVSCYLDVYNSLTLLPLKADTVINSRCLQRRVLLMHLLVNHPMSVSYMCHQLSQISRQLMAQIADVM